MGMYIIPAPNSKTLWRLVVDGELYEEGTLEEMEEAKERITLCRLFEEEGNFEIEEM